MTRRLLGWLAVLLAMLGAAVAAAIVSTGSAMADPSDTQCYQGADNHE